jgi:hypothetical protein
MEKGRGRATSLVRAANKHRGRLAVQIACQHGMCPLDSRRLIECNDDQRFRWSEPMWSPAGIEPATPSLPWNHQEPLCRRPFSQLAPDRRAEVIGSPSAKVCARPGPRRPHRPAGRQRCGRPAQRPTDAVSMRQLLNHTSGIPDTRSSRWSSGTRSHTDALAPGPRGSWSP